jgi:hypothetical protein
VNEELQCPQRCFTDRCSACDVGLHGLVLNIAQCVIHTYRVLGYCVEHSSVSDIHLQGVVLNIAQCVIHTYRMLC